MQCWWWLPFRTFIRRLQVGQISFGFLSGKKVIVGNCSWVKPVRRAKLIEDKKVKTESFSLFFRLSFFAKVIASEAFQARNSCQTSLPAFKHNEWDETSFCCRLIAKEKPKNNKLNKKLGQMWKCSGVYLVVADSSLWKFAPAVNFLLEGEPRPRWKRGNSPLFLLLTAFNPAI